MLGPELVAVIEAFFAKQGAAILGRPAPLLGRLFTAHASAGWTTERCTVSETGACSAGDGIHLEGVRPAPAAAPVSQSCRTEGVLWLWLNPPHFLHCHASGSAGGPH